MNQAKAFELSELAAEATDLDKLNPDGGRDQAGPVPELTRDMRNYKTRQVGKKLDAGGLGSGTYPAHVNMKSKSMRMAHKVLNARGWTYQPRQDSYIKNDLPGHAVTLDKNGAWTYTTGDGTKSGHQVDQLKVCMDRMSGKKY